MVLRRIGVLSAAKVSGILYAGLGLLIGGFFSLFAILGLGAAALTNDQGGGGAFLGLIFGIGSIVLFPLFYGVIGFLGGIVGAFLYNLAAGVVGGIELDLA